jgi:hypothetical protein
MHLFVSDSVLTKDSLVAQRTKSERGQGRKGKGWGEGGREKEREGESERENAPEKRANHTHSTH